MEDSSYSKAARRRFKESNDATGWNKHGNDVGAKALQAVYSGRLNVHKAAVEYNVAESSLRRRVKAKFTQWRLKKGRKYQILPHEERTYINFLNYMAENNLTRKEHEFLDDIKLSFDTNKIKTDFPNNRPGHGWYHKFMNRNRNKLRRHNASSTHSKLLRFVCESKERARVNLGQNRIKHQRDTVYQLISKGYKLGEESFVTIMVAFNVLGDNFLIICYPEHCESEELRQIRECCWDVTFLSSVDGQLKRVNMIEAVQKGFPRFQQTTMVFIDWPQKLFHLGLYEALREKNCYATPYDRVLHQILDDKDNWLSNLNKYLTTNWKRRNTGNEDIATQVGMVIQDMCNYALDNCKENVCNATCIMYGIYPISAAWLSSNIHDIKVTTSMIAKLDMNTVQMRHESAPKTRRIRRRLRAPPPTDFNGDTVSVAVRRTPNTQRRARPTPQENPLVRLQQMLQEGGANALLMNFMHELTRRKRRTKQQMANLKQWQARKREERKNYIDERNRLKAAMRNLQDEERQRQQYYRNNGPPI